MATRRRTNTGRPTSSRPKTRRDQNATGKGMRAGRYRPVGKKSSPIPMIVGGVVGGVLLLVLVILLATGGSNTKENHPSKNSEKPYQKPADVTGLVREGHRFCGEGHAILQAAVSRMGPQLSDEEKRSLRKELEEALTLIQRGLGMFEEAQNQTGEGYDVKTYQEAIKTIRMKLGELPN